MCTLLVCSQLWPGLPLLVAANRDERLGRASAPPRVEVFGSMRMLAPRDLVAGGTWLGLSEAGVFAGLTNRAGVPPDHTRRSRGELVLHALLGARAAEGAARVQALRARDYNGFHLIIADRAGAHLCWGDGEALRGQVLGPGVHVVTERSLGAATTGRAEALADWTRQWLAAHDTPPDDATLRARLAFHDEREPFDATCVHLPAVDYGTVSSTLLRLGAAEDDVRLAHADGPPCTTPHEDQAPLVRTLLRSGPLAPARGAHE